MNINTNRGIYKITNVINGMIYIGSSVELKKRITQHKSDLRNNRHHSPRLQNSFNKYGKENFVFEIIEELDCDRETLREVEQHYLDKYNSYDRNTGFNINSFATGGGLFGEDNPMFGNGHLVAGEKNGFYGKKHSNETKATLSLLNSGLNSSWFGRQHKPETKKKISKALTGRGFSNEHKENISKSIKEAFKDGRLQPNGFSQHARKRQRETHIIGVVMLSKDGEFIEAFDSVKEASEHIGVGSENITRVCKGKNNTSGGYKWMYLEEYEKMKVLQ